MGDLPSSRLPWLEPLHLLRSGDCYMVFVHRFAGTSYMLFGHNHFAVMKDSKSAFVLVLTFDVDYTTLLEVEDFAEKA